MAGESEMRMFQLDADGRHEPGDLKRRLARLAGGWLWFAAWRLATVTGELLSPSHLKAALRPGKRKRKKVRSDATVPPGDERLDRFG
jgi:hypothetical protein